MSAFRMTDSTLGSSVNSTCFPSIVINPIADPSLIYVNGVKAAVIHTYAASYAFGVVDGER